MVLCVSCLSRLPVQQPQFGCSSGIGLGRPAAVARAGGHQLFLPAPVWPAHVHHPQAVQQEDCHQWQEQRDGGRQGRLSVSVPKWFVLCSCSLIYALTAFFLSSLRSWFIIYMFICLNVIFILTLNTFLLFYSIYVASFSFLCSALLSDGK